MPELTNSQRNQLAVVSQRMGEFALTDPVRRLQMLPAAVAGVCQTVVDAQSTSLEMILSAISPEQDALVRVKSLNWVARNVKYLFATRPDFVAQIYEQAFEDPVDSDTSVPLYESAIMPMTTTLRQEYESAVRQLGDAFEGYLNVAPIAALSVLGKTIRRYGSEKCQPSGELPSFQFSILGQSVEFKADGSSVWDSTRAYEHDPEFKMLAAFESWMSQAATDSDGGEGVPYAIEILAASNPPAMLWRRLLRLGATHPTTIGFHLGSAMACSGLLSTPDTMIAASECIQATHPHLDQKDRQAIEEAILELPSLEHMAADERRWEKRDRLLACILPDLLLTDVSKQIIADARKPLTPEKEVNHFAVRGMSAEDVDRHVLSLRDGIEYDAPANSAFRAALQPLDELNKRFRNDTPSAQDIVDIAGEIETIREAASTAEEQGVDREFVERAIGKSACASQIILRNDASVKDPQLLQLVTDVLIEASQSDRPEFSADRNESFEKSVSWGGGLPRIEATQGLMLLARFPEGATPEVLDAIDRLSQDPVNSVRFFVAERVRCLYNSANDAMWRIAERLASDESYAVVTALVQHFLHRLLRIDMDRVIPLAHSIFDRMPVRDVQRNPRYASLDLFLDAYVNLNDESARGFLFDQLAMNTLEYLPECSGVVHGLRDMLVCRPTDDNSEYRQRAWNLLNAIIRPAMERWSQLCCEYATTPSGQIPQSAIQLWESLATLLNSVATELFFASGADTHTPVSAGGEEAANGLSDVRRTFWSESQESLQLLESVALAPAVHHLVELLHAFIEVDPEDAFIRIGKMVVASDGSGYANDSLAVDLVVKTVNRYLAEYRHVLRNSEECRRLMIRVLDVFVNWPQARRLVYRLDEIYR